MHLDDALALVLESEQTTVTVALLARCAEACVPVIICRTHRPAGLLLPVGAGWNTGAVRRAQAGLPRGSRKARKLWQHTIRSKLETQAVHLDLAGLRMGERIRRMKAEVSPTHPETTEAQASAIYWRTLFPGFERSDEEDPKNRALNWGYAVLMATTARALTALGCDPSLGFGHSSATNAWALAYDLMEPFRPTVDNAVRKWTMPNGTPDMTAIKEDILQVFANDGPAKKRILATAQAYRHHLMEGTPGRIPYPEAPLTA